MAASTLPKLAACQLATSNVALAYTAAAMLSLPPPVAGTAAQQLAAAQLLLQASQLSGSLSGCHPLLPSSLAPATPSGGLAEPAVDLTAALTAAPPKAAVSRFFGRTGASGAPLLAPPPRRFAAGEGEGEGSIAGALAAAVGDALPVRLVVHNRLAVALPLRGVALTMAVLQEMTGG